ncbi:aldo/keto reductase [Corynebacterium liangguodongii]|uniref:Aldo/keto reductase n=1 Tax=Corynebacterium liangguodongii TaxID=2079535 RepID=A0A2S0WCY8_9CORY|nr:aldo/keto reductase [Corynebacterium liangguodongii]AWB83626.1 aldo/keto reductase [Corynebacterium liangguodongii]PWB99566.1 aldo/keto reductase [Corynebacterium liangguodongii]
MAIPVMPLNNGSELPLIGLGTYKLDNDQTGAIVREAIELGYRHIDTAKIYGNEEAVGKAVNGAIAAGDVAREDLFITTKLWNDDQDRPERAFEESLGRLGLDYLDLYLVHWPWPQRGLYASAYEEIVGLRETGKLKAVGVSNFYPEVLDEIIAGTGVTPVLNQVELHAGFTQDELRGYHKDKGIVTEAWSPLARGANFSEAALVEVADKHGATPAQVALAYLVGLGCSVIPKTANPRRLAENLAALDIKLDAEDVAALDRMPGERQSADPLSFPGEYEG